MMKQEGSDKKNSYWDNLWGKQKDNQSSGMGDVKVQKKYKIPIIGNKKKQIDFQKSLFYLFKCSLVKYFLII